MSHQRFVSRLYRWLLHLYPAEFRKRYGSEMLQVLEDRARNSSRLATICGMFSGPRSSSTFRLASRLNIAESPLVTYAIEEGKRI